MEVLNCEINVPAKINLWLEVIGKRTDGYHELSSLMLPIGVYDRIEMEFGRGGGGGGGISIECDRPGIPTDGRNLAWRAAAGFLEAASIRTGVHIRLRKSIPAGAGLGGGSADGAAVLLAMNRVFEGRLSRGQLEEIALKLGADVPFFLYGQPALATGIGEKLERVRGLPSYPLVLVKPPITVSTAWVYGSLKLTSGRSNIKLARILTDPWRLAGVLRNDLETVTLTEYPLVAEIKEWLLQQGAVAALMSGSGPTVFGVFRDAGHADEVAGRAGREWERCWVAKTEVLTSDADS